KPEPLPVVESYLNPGKPIQVTVTREILYGSSDTLMPLTGLQVKIANSGQTYLLPETSPGKYESVAASVVAGATYQLSFDYNSREVTAQTTVPASPGTFTASGTQMVVPQIGPGMQLPEPIVYRWQNPEQAYHLMVVKNVEANPQPITFNLGDNVIEKPEPVFRLPPMKGEQQQLSLGRFSYYGRHAVILYRIQPEYAALYEDTSNNSNNLLAPPSNIRNGLGIFTAVNAADTLWVQVR
ncbi:MAG TPA: DUF4249 family protein, partial [Sphingobacteriaceae bacterium]